MTAKTLVALDSREIEVNLLIKGSEHSLDQCEALLNMISQEAHVEQTQDLAPIGTICWIDSNAYSADCSTGLLIMMCASVTSLLKPIWPPSRLSPGCLISGAKRSSVLGRGLSWVLSYQGANSSIMPARRSASAEICSGN